MTARGATGPALVSARMHTRSATRSALVSALAVACSGSPSSRDVAGAPVGGDLRGALGWVTEVAAEPGAFAALTEVDRDGWIALHAHAYADAVAAFRTDPVGRGRAELALAVLHDDLDRISGVVHEELFGTWSGRAGGLPPGPEAPLVAALAAHCAGGSTAAQWARQATQGPDAAVAAALVEGRSPFEVDSAGPFGQRLALHRAARASGDPAPLLAAATEPILRRPEQGFEREFWDPCVHDTLAYVWTSRAVADLGAAPTQGQAPPAAASGGAAPERWRALDALVADGAPLATRLFAPWPTTDDLRADLATAAGPGLLGQRAPSLARLGVGTTTPATDDPEAAKQEVRALDAALDAARLAIDERAPPEGAAVVADLRLVDRLRQEWLVARARGALADGHPRRAETYLGLARDHTSRTLGPENAPALFVLLAEARFRTHHTREALDALHLLGAGFPEARGLVEAAGDLAVLQGIDIGESKEE